ENLRRLDRIRVHAYSGPARPGMDPAATGNASAQTFNTSCSPGGAVAGSARSGIVRDFPAYPLRRTKTLFVTGIGNSDGGSRNNPAQMPGRRGRGDLHGHGPSWAAQCTCEFSAQIAQSYFHRV